MADPLYLAAIILNSESVCMINTVTKLFYFFLIEKNKPGHIYNVECYILQTRYFENVLVFKRDN